MNELLSLEDLFNRKIFRIPDYQRGYSWGELQLEEFWSDILNLLPGRDHYTGMISLKELSKSYTNNEKWNDERWLLTDLNYKAYHVVDGQQRLTTFVILINEIVKFYKNMFPNKSESEILIKNFKLENVINNYLSINEPSSNGILKSFKFGYEVDNPSYEFFKHKILEEPNGKKPTESFYTLKLEKAKEFFSTHIKEEYEKKGLSSIETIFKKVTQNLKFNMYYIDDDFNVFLAFETMNNRGKRLSNLELLKNRLIYLSTLFDDREDVKIKVRNNINDTWKEVYTYLGKNKDNPLSDEYFLQDHWIIYFGYIRKITKDNQIYKFNYQTYLLNYYFNQNRIFEQSLINLNDDLANDTDEYDENDDEIQENKTINSNEKLSLNDINKYVNSINNIIKYWYIVQNPSKDSDEFSSELIEMLNKLNRLQISYFRPLVTVLLSKNNVSIDKKIECLKKIERYIFLYFRLANYQQTYKSSFFWNLAHRFYIDEVTIDEIISEINTIDYLDENNCIAYDAPLHNITRLLNKYKGYYSWGPIKYFLYEYELFLMNKGANQKIYPEKLFKKDEKDQISIEHIYPQTATEKYWIDRFSKYPDEKSQRILTNSLGNLLPLSLSINIKLQNSSFDNKKQGTDRERGYRNGSHSEMEVAQCKEWTPKEILKRGLKMLDFMEKRFDFKFPSEEYKIKFLGLDFLTDEIEKLENAK